WQSSSPGRTKKGRRLAAPSPATASFRRKAAKAASGRTPARAAKAACRSRPTSGPEQCYLAALPCGTRPAPAQALLYTAPEHELTQRRADDDLDVEPQRPCLDIFEIIVNAPDCRLGIFGAATEAVDLRKPGDTGLHAVPLEVVG